MSQMVTFDEAALLAAAERIYAHRSEIEALADAAVDAGISNILICSSGGSQAMIAPFEYLINTRSSLPVKAILAAELVLTGCNSIDNHTLVLMASKSGDTKETLAAAQWLQAYDCQIFSAIGAPNSPLETLSTQAFVYEEGRPQELVLYLYLGCILNRLGGFADYPAFADELAHLGEALVSVRKQFDARSIAYCKAYHAEPYHIWVGSGDLWPVCYAYAMCVLEESQWIRTKSVSSPEFFHGTLELLEDDVPLTLLVGEGATRELDLRVKTFAAEHTSKLTVIDTADFDLPGISDTYRALLSPAVMNAALQRISKNMEHLTQHSLDIRRYYRKVAY